MPSVPAASAPAAGAEIDPSTRERLLEIALQAFSELGYDGASTREIAARAGVNQGLIPYYFGTKERLWREAVDRAFVSLREGLGDLPGTALEAAGGDRDQVEALIRRFVRFVAHHPEFARLMHDEGKRDGPRMRWLVDRHVRPLNETLLAVLTRVRHLGSHLESIDAVHFHYLVVGAGTILFHQGPEFRRLTGRDPYAEETIERHADALIALLLGPRERSAT